MIPLRAVLTCTLLAAAGFVQAQPYGIGNTVRNWYDAARLRDVAAELHYPAVADGDDQAIAAGIFPVLIVGHGFVMTVDAYAYLWQHFVPLGYIVVLPTTEGGFTPDHAAFGADLAFCAQRMQEENADAQSIFLGHVAASSALLGHSMGGGAALLGAAGNQDLQAAVVLAPAETEPSAIAAAAGVPMPTLIFAASEDCVTPIDANQQPMYDALLPCKALVNISGGGHCYFGDDNFLCSFGEFTCGPDLTITREAQHAVVTDLATLWLDHHLRGQATALIAFEDSMATTTRAATQYQCLSTYLPEVAGTEPRLWPSPVDDVLFVTHLPAGVALRLVDALGREEALPLDPGGRGAYPVAALPNGIHHLVLRMPGRIVSRSFIVAH